jgi:PHD/YefM family antitoxin component YafN of YafNO toxin-antitoxin module
VVGINKNGKPVAVVVSIKEYKQLESLKQYKLEMLLKEGINDLQSGKISDGNDVIDRLHKRI